MRSAFASAGAAAKIRNQRAVSMRVIFAIIISAIALVGCNQDSDVTGSVETCAKQLYTPYNPRDMKQCVAACIACERGVTTTCSTSCMLKGAH